MIPSSPVPSSGKGNGGTGGMTSSFGGGPSGMRVPLGVYRTGLPATSRVLFRGVLLPALPGRSMGIVLIAPDFPVELSPTADQGEDSTPEPTADFDSSLPLRTATSSASF